MKPPNRYMELVSVTCMFFFWTWAVGNVVFHRPAWTAIVQVVNGFIWLGCWLTWRHTNSLRRRGASLNQVLTRRTDR